MKVPQCISSPLLSLMATVSPDWMNSMTPKGSSFFRTVMLTSLWLPRRLGGVLWLLSTTENVSSSCVHIIYIQTQKHTHEQFALIKSRFKYFLLRYFRRLDRKANPKCSREGHISINLNGQNEIDHVLTSGTPSGLATSATTTSLSPGLNSKMPVAP